MKANPLVVIASICLLLAACSNGNNSAAPGGNNPPTPSVRSATSPLTISNPGTIPLFAETRAITGVYLHNNTNREIKNISYKVGLNAVTQADGKYLNSCPSLPGNSSCFLKFEAPAFESKMDRLAANVQVNYKDNTGKARTFGQILNFEYRSSKEPGIHIASGGFLSHYGNDSGYATVYLYAGGAHPTDKYVIDKLSVGNGLEITNTTKLSGTEMSPGLINVVEVKAEAPSGSYQSSIDLKLKDGSEAHKNVFVLGKGDTKAIGKSFIPLLIATTESGSKSFAYLSNAGSESITMSNVTVTGKITLLSGNTCNGLLEPGSSCEIPFSVDRAPSAIVQAGTIDITYTGGVTSIPVNWITDASAYAWATISVRDPINLIATGKTDVVATVTNSGTYSLTIKKPTAKAKTGSAEVTVTDGDNGANKCEGTLLEPDQSCKYTLTVADANVELDRLLTTSVEATYSKDDAIQTLDISTPVTYHSRENRVVIQIQPSVVNQQAEFGQSDTQQVVVTNLGYKTTEPLTDLISGNPPAYWQAATTGCMGAQLAAGESCNIAFTLAPPADSTEESKQFTYTVLSSTESATATINTSIWESGAILGLSVAAVEADAGGTGEGNKPYVFKGSNGNAKSIRLTYTNKSLTTDLLIKGFDFTGFSPADYDLDNTNSTCLSGKGPGVVDTTLAGGSNCTVIFNYRPEGSQLSQAIEHTMNIAVPTVYVKSWSTGTAMAQTPKFGTSDTIFVVSKQAQLVTTFAIESNGTKNAQFKIYNVLNNAQGYSKLTVKDMFSNYVIKDSHTASANCGNYATDINNMLSHTCSLDSTTASAEVSYKVAPDYLLMDKPLTVALKIDVVSGLAANQVLSVTPSALNDRLNPAKTYLFYVKNGEANGMYACKIGSYGKPTANCIAQTAAILPKQDRDLGRGLAFYTDNNKYKYVYVSPSSNGQSIYRCDMDINAAEDNMVRNCTAIVPAGIDEKPTGASGLEVNGNNLYIAYTTSKPYAYVVSCKINAADGSIANCKQSEAPTSTLWTYGIAYNQGYVYIRRDHEIASCKTNNDGVITSTCFKQTTTPGDSAYYTGLVVAKNGYLYAANYNTWGLPNADGLVFQMLDGNLRGIPFEYTSFTPDVTPASASGITSFGDYLYVASSSTDTGVPVVEYKTNNADSSLQYMNSTNLQGVLGDIRVIQK